MQPARVHVRVRAQWLWQIYEEFDWWIIKSWGFGELKNGAKGEEKHSCEAIPALCFL